MSVDWKKEIRDQLAHMLAACMALFPAVIFPSVITLAWAGFCLGTVREVTEVKGPFTLWLLGYAIRTSKLDIFFWTLGGGLVGLAS